MSPTRNTAGSRSRDEGRDTRTHGSVATTSHAGGHAMQKLAAARAAFAARDWAEAHDGFLAARQEAALDADDLSALAGASWWLGLMDESLAVAEEAYGRYLEAS